MKDQGREDLTRYIDENPFSASFEVKLVDPGQSQTVADALHNDPAVRNVLDTKDTAKNVKTVTDIMRTAGTVVLIVIAVIVLFIIVNTIRLAVFARAEEIEIMRLVGASDAFIRWPFVFEGAMVGLLGAAITLAGLYFLSEPIAAFMVDFFRVLPLSFGSLARDLVLIVFGAGLGLGVLGSWLSVRTYLIR
jgi:cell division transport system permease protein